MRCATTSPAGLSATASAAHVPRLRGARLPRTDWPIHRRLHTGLTERTAVRPTSEPVRRKPKPHPSASTRCSSTPNSSPPDAARRQGRHPVPGLRHLGERALPGELPKSLATLGAATLNPYAVLLQKIRDGFHVAQQVAGTTRSQNEASRGAAPNCPGAGHGGTSSVPRAKMTTPVWSL